MADESEPASDARPEASSLAQRTCDLQHVACVLPGRRAGRLLLGELLRVCQSRGLRLVPPRVLTPGRMIDVWLDLEAMPVASALESKLAWLAALRSSSDDELAPLVPDARQRQREDDPAPGMELAGTIAALHDELASEMRTFADVADAAERREMFNEGERWRTLERLQHKQRQALGKAGLIDRNDARAQRLAATDRQLSPANDAPQHVVLIGVADLGALQRLVLHRLSAPVTALVHAPRELTDAFDELGTVRLQAWSERRLDIADEQIVVAEKHVDQAREAMHAIARLASSDSAVSASDITLGAGDPAISCHLKVAAGWAGLAVHNAAGESLARSGSWRVLAAALDFLEHYRFDAFATLLRHPDLERAIVRHARAEHARQQWLSLLDKYFADHLQGHCDGEWLGEEEEREALKGLWDSVRQLLAPIADASAARPLNEWCQPLLDVLANIYAIDSEGGDRLPAADVRSIDACLEAKSALQEVAFAAPSLLPEVNAIAGARLLLDHLAAATSVDDPEPDQIEMLGWLELHLDIAPALILTGCNDRHIPEAVTSDAFLPDSLRAHLGLMHNARRYARDAYLLQAIVKSRPYVRLIAGRRSDLGDPLTPSRLLLACDDQTLVRRVKMFAHDQTSTAPRPTIGLPRLSQDARSQFVVPPIPAALLNEPQAMAVTDFGRYLRCPYRWALEKLLGLQSFSAAAAELDPLRFGSLAHDALCALRDEPKIAASDDADRVFRFLSQQLHKLAKEKHGPRPLPAIAVQIARLEQRLRSFSEFQARSAAEGWRIEHCEVAFEGDVSLDIPGQPDMPLRGRIDRIDRHIHHAAWRVIDYKTGERGDHPLHTHHQSKDLPPVNADLQWCDLQLPLYHLLVTRSKSLNLPADRIQLGYVVLPRQVDGARWLCAEWSPAHLAHALDCARQIVRDIRAAVATGEFMREDIDARYDVFARICQTTAFRAGGEDADSGLTNGQRAGSE